MSWQRLLTEQRVKRHITSHQELRGLRALVDRDLTDAALTVLSADRRFATAYNAVLQLAQMITACAGYRVTGVAHHRTTWEALELAMGTSTSNLVAYFDTCRRKRNQVDYDRANIATDTEVEELLQKAQQFRKLVEDWISQNHPTLKQ